MAVTAIICEYNPFHKGHKYQIDKLKELYPSTKVISVMSPDFVQRGRPAVFDKYVRGECALRCGTDLAVSMPQVCALLSAEGFAESGVRIAKRMGADSLAFGVEDDCIQRLIKIAETLISYEFEQVIKEELQQGVSLSYPVIRQRALRRFAGDEADLISTPNNILAVEYIKACMRYCPEMKLIPIKRIGNGHADSSVNGDVLSASAIRNIMSDNGDWTRLIPEETANVLKNAVMIDTERYDDLLFAALSVSDAKRIRFAFGNKELSDTVCSAIGACGTYREFRQMLSRRKFPETKIDRGLCAFILNCEKDEYMHAEPEYVTLLASNGIGRVILKSSNIPVITKFSDKKCIDQNQIEHELLAEKIWARCSFSPSGERYFVDKKPFITEV